MVVVVCGVGGSRGSRMVMMVIEDDDDDVMVIIYFGFGYCTYAAARTITYFNEILAISR
jgi:hypothetical protein